MNVKTNINVFGYLNLTEDTLIIRQSEYIFYATENGKEIEAQYGDGLMPIYTYVRKHP